MKQKLLLTIAIFVLAFGSMGSGSASAQTQLPAELEYVDAQVDVFLPYLDSFQAEYYAEFDQYFQALNSHSSPPAGVEPAILTSHPEDQEATLAALWEYANLPLETNWALRIDIYSGPDGDGYVLIISTTVDNVVWTKSINHGPDTWNDIDWYQVEG